MQATETSDEQALQAQKGANVTYTRSWKVLVAPGEAFTLYDVQSACGVALDDIGPGGTKCTSIRLQGTDSRLLYKLQAEYTKAAREDNPLDEPDSFSWSFSLGTAPAVFALESRSSSTYNKPIINSAKDPLEGVSMDVAEARLRISGNRPTFASGTALAYVNAVNADSYAGGAPGTWKVQGIEASTAQTTVSTPGGGSLDVQYWKVTIDLAYRSYGWSLRLLDVGYNEIVNGKKVPICVPRLDKLVGQDADDQQKNVVRAEHRCADPQALNKNGTAKTEGEPPEEIEYFVYRQVTFAGVVPQPPG